MSRWRQSEGEELCSDDNEGGGETREERGTLTLASNAGNPSGFTNRMVFLALGGGAAKSSCKNITWKEEHRTKQLECQETNAYSLRSTRVVSWLCDMEDVPLPSLGWLAAPPPRPRPAARCP